MSEDTAAELIVALAHRSPWSTSQVELETHLRDFVLASRVRVALIVNGWSVQVQARDGVVQLAGEVQLLPSEEMDDVVALASSVPVVREVNLDRVQPRILA